MMTGFDGQITNVLTVPKWIGGDRAKFSTTAYLNTFGLQSGTGKFLFPRVAFEGEDGYIDLSRSPGRITLTSKTIPELMSTAEMLAIHAQRVWDKSDRSINATGKRWWIDGEPTIDHAQGFCVGFITGGSGRWIQLEKNRGTFRAIIGRGCESDSGQMEYRIVDNAVHGIEFGFSAYDSPLRDVSTLDRVKRAVGLPSGATACKLVAGVATRLYMSGLYFVGDERFGAEGFRSGFDEEGEPAIIERQQQGDVNPPTREVSVRFGETNCANGPTLEVKIRVPGDALCPLKTPIMDTLWKTILKPMKMG